MGHTFDAKERDERNAAPRYGKNWYLHYGFGCVNVMVSSMILFSPMHEGALSAGMALNTS